MIKNHVKDVSMILFGNIVMAFAYASWMVPNKIINGGVTSLSQIISKFSNFDIPMVNNFLLFGLLVLTLIFLGKEIFIKSIISSVSYSVFFTLFFHMKLSLQLNPIIDMLISTIFISFGYFACISSNASTVGVDVFALIINKYFPKMKIAVLIKIFNILILAIGFFTFGFYSVLLGIVFAEVYSRMLNWMLTKKYSKV